MKIKFIIYIILAILIVGCNSNSNGNPLSANISTEQEVKNMNTVDNDKPLDGKNKETVNINTSEGEQPKRLFIELEYLESIENADYTEFYYFNDLNENAEFTWWERVYTNQKKESISNYFEFIVPEYIDITQKDFIVSYGRKLKYLYYEDEYIPEGLWDAEHYLASPVFEREYKRGTAHIYLIDKVKLGDNEFLTFDMYEFNEKGNIPFELPPEYTP